jgi:DNA end-binding protein Ku
MRSIWKGTINFMVMTIPTKAYKATEDGRVPLHNVHAKCGSQLEMPKWCPTCDRKVEAAEVVKGYGETSPFVILTEADLQALPLKSVKQIDVVSFVSLSEIDIRAFGEPYYIGVDLGDSKKKTVNPRTVGVYNLLMRAMEKAGVVAIGKWSYRDKEHLSVLRPFDGILLLQTLHYADEIRDHTEAVVKGAEPTEKEMELALMLVERMKGAFDLSSHQNEYRAALEKLIEAKATGTVAAAVQAAEAPVADVAEALLKSLELAGAKR